METPDIMGIIDSMPEGMNQAYRRIDQLNRELSQNGYLSPEERKRREDELAELQRKVNPQWGR